MIPPVSCVYGGAGIHMWNVTPAMFDVYQKVSGTAPISYLHLVNRFRLQKTILAAAVIYLPALAFAKVGLIILYHRIINKQRGYKWALHIISGIICAYSIAISLALIFACNPIQRSWDSSITRGSCIDRAGLYIATAVTNIVSDLALILVPVPLVLGLQMPRIQKVGLLGMFIVGCG